MPVKFGTTVFAAAVLVAWPLLAPADDEDPIARCAGLATDSDRIACLEAAIRGQSEPASAHAPEQPVESLPPIDAAVPAPTKETFGLKEKQPPADQNTIRVTVVSVTKNLRGKLVFETESGQVWLQTGQREARFTDIPFEAEVRPAAMGSYFIRPTIGGISIRVRREE